MKRLALILLVWGCRERAAQLPASAASASATPRPEKTFRLVAKVHAFDWGADSAAANRAQQLIGAHLEAEPFRARLASCYAQRKPAVPTDTTLFLTFDAEGRVTRSVLEGVPPEAAACVNQVFGNLRIEALGGAALTGGSVSGVLDVQPAN
ncbi:MAG: hypothetical protein ACOY0T_33795 [Myxococcota bacterium]